MSKLPSRLRRLEDMLFIFPDEDNAMLLSELDGFLTGLFLCPETVPRDEWLPVIWGGGAEPFDDPLDIRWLTDMVTARYDEIARDLVRGKPRPIFDIDERNGDVLWEVWIRGVGKAMGLRPDGWASIVDRDAEEALAGITTLISVAADTSDLTSTEINRICDEAPALIPSYTMRLHAGRPRTGDTIESPPARAAKVGRNDPCPCGSGAKAKRCCGVD